MGFAIIAVIAAVYLLPTVISAIREKKNTGAIFVLNLLLGWTLLGWIGALVWSLTVESVNHPSSSSSINTTSSSPSMPS